jgi:hypothetical protein
MTTDGVFVPLQPQPGHMDFVEIAVSLDRIHGDRYNMIFSNGQESILPFIHIMDFVTSYGYKIDHIQSRTANCRHGP